MVTVVIFLLLKEELERRCVAPCEPELKKGCKSYINYHLQVSHPVLYRPAVLGQEPWGPRFLRSQRAWSLTVSLHHNTTNLTEPHAHRLQLLWCNMK